MVCPGAPAQAAGDETAAASTRHNTVRLTPKTARSALVPPTRPYAINVESFFYAGQKFIIDGQALSN